MKAITTDTLLRDLLAVGEPALSVLDEYDLACAGCLGSGFETVGDAIRSHRLPQEEVLEKLNKALTG